MQIDLVKSTIERIEEEIYEDVRSFLSCFEESRQVWRRYNVGDVYEVPSGPPGRPKMEQLKVHVDELIDKVKRLDSKQNSASDQFQIMVADVQSKLSLVAESVDRFSLTLFDWCHNWVGAMTEFSKDVFGRMDVLKHHLNIEYTPSVSRSDEMWACPQSIAEIELAYHTNLTELDSLHHWLDTYKHGHVVVGTSVEAELIGSDTDILLYTFLPILQKVIQDSKDTHDLMMGGEERLQFCRDSRYFEEKFKKMGTVKKRQVIENQRKDFLALCRMSWELGLHMKIKDEISCSNKRHDTSHGRRAADFRKKTTVVGAKQEGPLSSLLAQFQQREKVDPDRETFILQLRLNQKARDTLNHGQRASVAFNDPWSGAREGCTIVQMRELILEEKQRRQHQEGRVFNINDPDKVSGEKLLLVACWASNAHMVKFLISQGCNPDVIDNSLSKSTALHMAARSGKYDIVQYLLQAQLCSLEAQDGHGDTALHWASRRGHLAVVEMLLGQGCLHTSDDGDLMHPYSKMLTARNFKGKRAWDVSSKRSIERCFEKFVDLDTIGTVETLHKAAVTRRTHTNVMKIKSHGHKLATAQKAGLLIITQSALMEQTPTYTPKEMQDRRRSENIKQQSAHAHMQAHKYV
jgi:hypothetical protein